MREDFWPFVSACAVVVCSSLLVGVYAVKRTWFTDQKVDFATFCLFRSQKLFYWKVDYGTYEAAGMADMEMVRQPTQVKKVLEIILQLRNFVNAFLLQIEYYVMVRSTRKSSMLRRVIHKKRRRPPPR